MLRVFVGFDPRQIISYTVLQMAAMQWASKPIAITPLVLETLPITRRGLTPFTYSRFLVPWLCGYEGTAVFLDADIMPRADLYKLAALADESADVSVCQGPMRFEWSSVMVFNNAKCSVLTPEYVQDERNGLLDLAWAKKVGALPLEWNHLVGYDAPNPKAKLVHFTQGVPAYPETKDSEHAAEWVRYQTSATSTLPWRDIMGNSVHAKPVYERLEREKAA